MVHTTPIEKALEHQVWHKFLKGGCAYCGFTCDDCPTGVATCKCKPNKEEVEFLADMRLKQENSNITDDWKD